MWNVTIISKSLIKGYLSVVVRYTRGEETFEDLYRVFNEGELNSKIVSRLEEMARLENAHNAIVIGAYTPVEVEKPVDPEEEALRVLRDAKSKLDLKIIDQAEYDAVLADYKALEK